MYTSCLIMAATITFWHPVECYGSSRFKVSRPKTASKAIFEQVYVPSLTPGEGHVEGIQ